MAAGLVEGAVPSVGEEKVAGTTATAEEGVFLALLEDALIGIRIIPLSILGADTNQVESAAVVRDIQAGVVVMTLAIVDTAVWMGLDTPLVTTVITDHQNLNANV